MTQLGIIHLPCEAYPTKQVRDAFGKVRSGWFVVENGNLSYPFETRDQAISHARGINSIRYARIASIRVIDAAGSVSEVLLAPNHV